MLNSFISHDQTPLSEMNLEYFLSSIFSTFTYKFIIWINLEYVTYNVCKLMKSKVPDQCSKSVHPSIWQAGKMNHIPHNCQPCNMHGTVVVDSFKLARKPRTDRNIERATWIRCQLGRVDYMCISSLPLVTLFFT